MQAIKKILNNRKHRNTAIISILCVAVAGFSIWAFTGNGNSPVPVSLVDQQAPAGNEMTSVSAGDIVVVNVLADEMDDVYGYQFDVHYDKDCLEYSKCLYSDIDDILTIFANYVEDFLLVGATMLGDMEGHNGKEIPVCRVEFTALRDFESGEDLASGFYGISRVNVVTGDLQYLEDIDGWSANIAVQ